MRQRFKNYSVSALARLRLREKKSVDCLSVVFLKVAVCIRFQSALCNFSSLSISRQHHCCCCLLEKCTNEKSGCAAVLMPERWGGRGRGRCSIVLFKREVNTRKRRASNEGSANSLAHSETGGIRRSTLYNRKIITTDLFSQFVFSHCHF